MKRFSILFIAGFASLCLLHPIHAIDDTTIWKEFILLVQQKKFSAEMIRPHYESLRQSSMNFVQAMMDNAIAQELKEKPEIICSKNQISYLIPLTLNQNKVTYSFTFVEENEKWYLQHIESIFIRLDKISALPTSEFPDNSEQQKAWQREEINWSQQVRLFNFLCAEKGKAYALNWFKDGAGYFLAAKTWVPFVEPEKAFILNLCWEQANLRRSKVTLEKLDENEAMIRIRPLLIDIYLQASHLKQQISFDDYVQIFTTIWEDRAEKAGWKLDIIGGDYLIGFHFKR
ncbi:hypothetical protein JW964_20800 [candidate division KSB1 bacterium]|nr:hypothetical protein [candidate division KSB1 bacterium]